MQQALAGGVGGLLALLGALAGEVANRPDLLQMGVPEAVQPLLGGWRAVQVGLGLGLLGAVCSPGLACMALRRAGAGGCGPYGFSRG